MEVEIVQAEERHWPHMRQLIELNPKLEQVFFPHIRHYRVALIGGTVKGCAGIDPHSRRLVELRGPAVDPDEPYVEVASPLVDACEVYAREFGATQILNIVEDETFFADKGYGSHFKEKGALVRLIRGTWLSEYERSLIQSNGASGIYVENAKEEDSPAIMRLLEFYPTRLVRDPSLLPDIPEFLVARQMGVRDPVGCVAFEYYSQKIGEFRSFATHPDYRAKGLRIGQRLAAHCIARAYEQKIFELLAIAALNGSQDDPSAHKLLVQKFGFGASQYGRLALVKVLN